MENKGLESKFEKVCVTSTNDLTNNGVYELGKFCESSLGSEQYGEFSDYTKDFKYDSGNFGIKNLRN